MDTFRLRIRGLRRAASLAAGAALLVLATGCQSTLQSLLPDSSIKTDVQWQSFEEARQALESIVPYESRLEDLNARGFDPASNPAVTVLSFSDILLRFNAGTAMRYEDYDRGIRDCLAASKSCIGYSLQIRRVKRERVGNFWLDSLNFVRQIDTTGFSFNALILLVDGTVVYRLYGGQPKIQEKERNVNPLGPLQGWGDAVPGLLR